jgi:hypothetical protein
MRRVVSVLLTISALGAVAWVETVNARAATEYQNSLNITCAQAQDYIKKNDGGVLATGDAYASFHFSYCSGQPAYVRTRNVKFCYIGQYCDCETTYCSQSYFQGQDN